MLMESHQDADSSCDAMHRSRDPRLRRQQYAVDEDQVPDSTNDLCQPGTSTTPLPNMDESSAMKLKHRWLSRHDDNVDSTSNGEVNEEPIPEVEPDYEEIAENEYVCERSYSKSNREVARMRCECTTSSAKRRDGVRACNEVDCINRLLFIECGQNCPCGRHCDNQRFQRRQYAPIERFYAGQTGWGVRARGLIQPGTFLIEFVAEVVNAPQFRRRLREYEKNDCQRTYIMSLGDDQILDCTRKGNISRFINHSCDANAETQKWTVNGELRIGVFAVREIQPGDEICMDYNYQRYGSEPERCYCGTTACRGYIGAKNSTCFDLLISPEKVRGASEEGSSEEEPRSEERRRSTKSRRRRHDEDVIDEVEDSTAISEVRRLEDLGQLRNSDHALRLCRLMLRTSQSTLRLRLLDILERSDRAVQRLFLDHYGLKILWTWTIGVEASTDPSARPTSQLCHKLCQVLGLLEIPHLGYLKSTMLLKTLERWSSPSFMDTLNDARPDEADAVQLWREVGEAAQALRIKWQTTLMPDFKIPRRSQEGRSPSPSRFTPSPPPVPRSRSPQLSHKSPYRPQPRPYHPTPQRSPPPPRPKAEIKSRWKTGGIVPLSDRVRKQKSKSKEKAKKKTERWLANSSLPTDGNGGSSSHSQGQAEGGTTASRSSSISLEKTPPPVLADSPVTSTTVPASVMNPGATGHAVLTPARGNDATAHALSTPAAAAAAAISNTTPADQPDSLLDRYNAILSAQTYTEQDRRAAYEQELGEKQEMEDLERDQAQAAQELQEIRDSQRRQAEEAEKMRLMRERQEKRLKELEEMKTATPTRPPPTYLPPPPRPPPTIHPTPHGPLQQPPPPVPPTHSQPSFMPTFTPAQPHYSHHMMPPPYYPQSHPYAMIPMPPLPPHPHQIPLPAAPPVQPPLPPLPPPPAKEEPPGPTPERAVLKFDETTDKWWWQCPTSEKFFLEATPQQVHRSTVLKDEAVAPLVVCDSKTGVPRLFEEKKEEEEEEETPTNETTAAIKTLQKQLKELQKQIESSQPSQKEPAKPKPEKKPHHVQLPQDPRSASTTTEEDNTPKQLAAMEESVNGLPPGWREAKDTDGELYYYHIETRETRWKKPEWNNSETPSTSSVAAPPKKKAKKSPPKPTRPLAKPTRAQADTSTAKKSRDTFKVELSKAVIRTLNPYRNPSVTEGRITSDDDFKHVARKITHTLMEKEMANVRSVDELKFTEHVDTRVRTFVKIHLRKFGKTYKRDMKTL